MVLILPFVGAVTLLSGWASALPRPDSSIGDEVAVSAPNGIVMSDTAELMSQLATATDMAYGASQTAAPAQMTASSNYGSSNYGSSNSGSSNVGSSNWGSSNYGSSSNSYGGSNSQSGSVASSQNSGSSYGGSSNNSPSYSMPTYGSGSSSWSSGSSSSSGYDDCVSQCVAKFGSNMGSYQAPTQTSNSASGSSGSGATHTVIVAPTQGVLRYIPFAVNASVGDTIQFMWGANNHTVTKSSSLLPCNKTGDAPFASGTQNKTFVFTQVVNDTNPTFFYCGTPTHCQKGMFGVINPASAFGTPTSFAGMTQSLAANDSDVSTYAAMTEQNTANNTNAATWGSNIDLSTLPTWSHSLVAENILFTRNFIASNPEVMTSSGGIDLSSSSTTPLMIPQDVAAALSSASPASNAGSSPPAVPSAATSPAAAPSSSPKAAASTNGAGSLASPRALVGFVVIVATFFAL